MIKQISPKYSKEDATLCMKALDGIPCLVFACVEEDNGLYRCVSYWNVDGEASRGQRNVLAYITEPIPIAMCYSG